jgi:hypothetical protein
VLTGKLVTGRVGKHHYHSLALFLVRHKKILVSGEERSQTFTGCEHCNPNKTFTSHLRYTRPSFTEKMDFLG